MYAERGKQRRDLGVLEGAADLVVRLGDRLDCADERTGRQGGFAHPVILADAGRERATESPGGSGGGLEAGDDQVEVVLAELDRFVHGGQRAEQFDTPRPAGRRTWARCGLPRRPARSSAVKRSISAPYFAGSSIVCHGEIRRFSCRKVSSHIGSGTSWTSTT